MRNYRRSQQAPVKVYAWLLEQHLPIEVTQTRMACEIGLSRASVNYALNYLRRHQVVQAETQRGTKTKIIAVKRRWEVPGLSHNACGLPALTAYVAGEQ